MSEKEEEHSFWKELDLVETASQDHLSRKLRDLDEIFQRCYDAGVIAPTLQTTRKKKYKPNFSALFLKRSLNDWRVMWILLRLGYTSQAGTVAASLWENALTSIAFISQPSAAKKLRGTVQGEIPWRAMDLAKITARHLQERAHTEKRDFSDSEVEAQWRVLYGAYNWLCNLKHPTVRAAYYDSKNTQVSPEGYVMMALPDTLDEDLRTKKSILCLGFLPFFFAVRCYGEHTDPSRQSQKSKKFFKLLDEAKEGIGNMMKDLPAGWLPVDNRDSRIAREWGKIMREKKNHK